ncbi:MAG TPA: hypothetical protein VML75_25715 [Kofleriaceae bacterium]|nr:hypothetical protein [Kofleriaceae bacterium]
MEADADQWAWTRPVWARSFAPIEAAGFRLRLVESAEYWAVHEAELRAHFPPEAFINTWELRTEAAVAGQARMAAARVDQPLRTFCIIHDGDAVAGAFCGERKSDSVYRMWHTNIHSDYRRRGLYRMILAGTIAYTAELGFDEIVSEHAPGNNPVLIAKLGAGFRITGLDVQPMVGLSVNLTYFHNADHLAAYEFRCGLATLTPRILANGSGAMDQLIAQMAAAKK